MPAWCMSRATTRIRVRVHSRVRVRSPSQQYKKTASFIKAQEKSELSQEINEFSFNNYLPESECGNRVMVVVDSSLEAKGALEWALSHTVQSQDTMILLHVAKQDEKTNGEIDQRAYDLLRSTKNICQLKRPEVHVELAVREGNEKGASIVEAAKRLRVSLLILGHRKQSFLRRLQMIWSSKRTRNRVVDYLCRARCTPCRAKTLVPRTRNKHIKFTMHRQQNFAVLISKSISRQHCILLPQWEISNCQN